MRLIVYSTLMLTMMSACNNEEKPKEGTKKEEHTEPDRNVTTVSGNYSQPIPIDSGNKMIQSYLTSINPTVNTGEIKSLIFDAELLRAFLNQNNATKVHQVKLMFAHRMSYINSGHGGERPDSNSNALTLVIVGIDGEGNYAYYGSEPMALDMVQPCPHACPEVGSAASDLLIPPTNNEP